MTEIHPKLPAAEGWQPPATAPQNASWVQLAYVHPSSIKPVMIIAHWAQDMSGEEQPPFRGWFRANLGDGGQVYGFIEVPQGWIAWRPLWPADRITEAARHQARVSGLLEVNSHEVMRRRRLQVVLLDALRQVYDEAERGRLEDAAREVMAEPFGTAHAPALQAAIGAYDAQASGYPVDAASLEAAIAAYLLTTLRVKDGDHG